MSSIVRNSDDDPLVIAIQQPRIAIESVSPVVEEGAYPAKTESDRDLRLAARIFADGHEVLGAEVVWRRVGETAERRLPLLPEGNDFWSAQLRTPPYGRLYFRIEAWIDRFAGYRRELRAKHGARLPLDLELREGDELLQRCAERGGPEIAAACAPLAERLQACQSVEERVALWLAAQTGELLRLVGPREHLVRSREYPVEVERPLARFASWYELFPRSESGDPTRHGTFDDVIRRLPQIAAMGFDVLYFPPIHPIGRTHRKGRNNSLRAEAGDPGSPYAIGSEEGGHEAIHPELGDREDFRRLLVAVREHGMELALDFAIQCSPDHPWLREHPGWFAGLSTALELRARGANVIVLEQQFVGFGASGRNAGYLLGSMGIECEVFVKRVGLEQARKFVGFYDEAVTYVEERLAALDIDCDYTPSGIIRAAVHPSQEKRLRANMELGHALGSVTRFVDSAEMRARGIPPAFLFGSEQRGGTLNPGKYVNGLRRAAIKAGVKLYERTPVLSYCEGQVITCNTAQGIATAPVMVLATNAYTPQLGVLRNKVAPIRVSAIETQPLSAEQLASLGWQEREGLITPHYTMESHRLTAHDTLLLTVKQLGYAYGSKTPNVPDHAAYAALSRVLRERFPSLQGLAIRHCWSGYISGAYDFLPVVGVTGARQNIFYTAGCSGHGLATQSLMGALFAERIGSGEPPLLAALEHKTPSMLPEPLQWCAIKTAFAAARLLDAWTDKKVRKDKALNG